MFGNYEVLNDGTILNSNNKPVKKTINCGREEVRIFVKGKLTTYVVARLVYKVNNPNWDLKSKEIVLFKDENKLNTHIDNLYLTDRSAIKKKKINQNLEMIIRKLFDDKTSTVIELASHFNVSTQTIRNILNDR